MTRKNILVFAHAPEAAIFLKNGKFIQYHLPFPGLYESEEHFLLITGEGPFLAGQKLAAVLSQYKDKISHMINLGVAGALSNDLSLNQIYSVRTVYREILDENTVPSFCSKDSTTTIDCISSMEKVLEEAKRSHLQIVASIVDRELWALASVCRMFKVPFYSYKVISDFANNKSICQEVQQRGIDFSLALYNHFQEYFKTHKTQQRSNLYSFQDIENFLTTQGFYFSVNQKRSLEKLITKLKNDDYQSLEDFFNDLNLPGIIETITHPKERTKALLKALFKMDNPLLHTLELELRKLTTPYHQRNIQIEFSPNYDNKKILLKSYLESEEDLTLLTENLKNFPINKISELLEGKITHVS